ncbi:hypothetical protein TYRP_002603 [Tyrophagus putrescentiae]|nr:hypothetical protein TYRP_002603 [Tyrophagus putrescentiae]
MATEEDAEEDVDALDDEDEWALPILGVKLIFSGSSSGEGEEGEGGGSKRRQCRSEHNCYRNCHRAVPKESRECLRWGLKNTMIECQCKIRHPGQKFDEE